MKYDELNDRQKAKAREWYRNNMGSDWYAHVYDDAIEIAKLMGIEIGEKPWRATSGQTGTSPAIYFSGFSCQGDGACFEGSYRYKADAGKSVAAHAPKDGELKRIAERLQTVQQEWAYGLRAKIQHRGHYYHEFCMDIDVEHVDAHGNETDTWGNPKLDEARETLCDLLRAFAKWIYGQLGAEYDAQQEDAYVEEQILANDYDFDIGTGGIRI